MYHKPNICAHDYLLKSAWFCVNILIIPSVSGTAFSAIDGPSRGLSRLAEPPPCLLCGFPEPGGAFGGYVVILLVCHEPIDAHVLLWLLVLSTLPLRADPSLHVLDVVRASHCAASILYQILPFLHFSAPFVFLNYPRKNFPLRLSRQVTLSALPAVHLLSMFI